MGKKVYVASRFSNKDVIRQIHRKLMYRGHEVSDWTNHKPIKPYDENQELSGQYAKEDLEAAADCEVFILLLDGLDVGTGAFVELGAALQARRTNSKPEIFVIDAPRSMFYFHPGVNRVKDLDEVLDWMDVNG